jgi:hypothetical protein
MLALAGERRGALYHATPSTAMAREIVGPDKILAVEQSVVLSTDPEEARRVARASLAIYLGLPNYTNNWKRLGFTDADLADGGSDRFVDAVVAWGDDHAIKSRVEQHLAPARPRVSSDPHGRRYTHRRWRRLSAAPSDPRGPQVRQVPPTFAEMRTEELRQRPPARSARVCRARPERTMRSPRSLRPPMNSQVASVRPRGHDRLPCASARTNRSWADGFEDRAVGGRSNPTSRTPGSVRRRRRGRRGCAGRAFEGAPGRAHGGIVAAAFDDVTGFVIGQLRNRPSLAS